MILTAEERRKFAVWCLQEASSNKVLLEQMKKLPGMKVMVEDYTTKTAACAIVAKILGLIQEETIENGQSRN